MVLKRVHEIIMQLSELYKTNRQHLLSHGLSINCSKQGTAFEINEIS